MTPALFSCTQQCLFCWRAQGPDFGVSWNEIETRGCDDPEEIVKGCLKAQRRILSGYFGNGKASIRKVKEACSPKQVAISLSGEPALYERLGELIQVFHRRGFTTFLVTNGTMPSVLSELCEEPTQLYVSLCAPDESIFKETCRPLIPDAWKRLNETLNLLSSFKCPSVVRITSVRGLNMVNVKGYAKLVENAEPTYVEPKGYVHVGFSTLRLGYENMPSHEEVKNFAKRIAEETGYNSLDESCDSRVVLLSRMRKVKRFDC